MRDLELLLKWVHGGSFATKGQTGTGKTTMMAACIRSLHIYRLYTNSPKGNLAAVKFRQPQHVLDMVDLIKK